MRLKSLDCESEKLKVLFQDMHYSRDCRVWGAVYNKSSVHNYRYTDSQTTIMNNVHLVYNNFKKNRVNLF